MDELKNFVRSHNLSNIKINLSYTWSDEDPRIIHHVTLRLEGHTTYVTGQGEIQNSIDRAATQMLALLNRPL